MATQAVSRHRPTVHLTRVQIESLTKTLKETGADIVLAGKLQLNWSNGDIKKMVVFEHQNGVLTDQMFPPPDEPAPFLPRRWQPFSSYVILKKEIFESVPRDIYTDNSKLLRHCLRKGYTIHVDPSVTAIEHQPFSLALFLKPKKLARVNKFFRDLALQVMIVFSNLKLLLTEGQTRQKYFQQIASIKKNKEIILDLKFGGLGDVLVYSSLPRLLKETYDIDFYLSEDCRNICRSEDIFTLCFEYNPYFKGFKSTSNNIFQFKSFVRDKSRSSWFTDRSKQNVTSALESQFKVKGEGIPEIFYKPQLKKERGNILLCDLNWHSGEKWGLYNDQKIIDSEIESWLSQHKDNKVEYVDTSGQDIFAYVDKIANAGKFLTLFSGGNALASTQQTKTTVIVPENLEGTSITSFLFRKKTMTYKRRKSLAGYGL